MGQVIRQRTLAEVDVKPSRARAVAKLLLPILYFSATETVTAQEALPDSARTPDTVDPAVTQATIDSKRRSIPPLRRVAAIG
jgi:hypothetical protein